MLRASVCAVGIRVFTCRGRVVLGAMTLLLLLSSVVRANQLRFRGGVRNAPEKPRLSDNQLKQVLKSLREKTGWQQLQFDAEGFLVCSDLTAFNGGSAAARQLLSAAMASAQAFDLEAHDRSSAVAFARLATPVNYESRRTGEKIEVYPLQVDFGDFYQLRGDNDALKAFDIGLVILHELAHGVWSLRDARTAEEEPGECESYVNRIRRELNLPERTQYLARVRPGTLNLSTGTRMIAELVFNRKTEKAGKPNSQQLLLQWEAQAVGASLIKLPGKTPEITAAMR